MTSLTELIATRYAAEGFMAALVDRMRSHGITQAAVARRAGVCPTQMSRWVHERVTPGLETRIRLDEAVTTLIYPNESELPG